MSDGLAPVEPVALSFQLRLSTQKSRPLPWIPWISHRKLAKALHFQRGDWATADAIPRTQRCPRCPRCPAGSEGSEGPDASSISGRWQCSLRPLPRRVTTKELRHATSRCPLTPEGHLRQVQHVGGKERLTMHFKVALQFGAWLMVDLESPHVLRV